MYLHETMFHIFNITSGLVLGFESNIIEFISLLFKHLQYLCFTGDSKSSQSELTGALEKNGGCLYAVALTLYTLSLLVFLAASVSLLFIF